MFKSLKTKLILIVSLLIFGAISSVSFLTYVSTVEKVETMLGERALGIARSSSTLIDGDKHQTVLENISIAADLPEFKEIKRQLTKIKEINKLKTDVYTLSKVWWVENTNQQLYVTTTSNEPFTVKGDPLTTWIKDSIEKKTNGYTDIKTTPNGSFITGYAPIETSDGSVSGVLEVALETTKEVATAKNELIKNIAMAGAFALLVGFFITFFVSGGITKPIISLSSAAKEMSEGNLDAQATPVGKDEIAGLANTFNAMSKNLKVSYEKLEDYSKNLEQMVEEKTATISMIIDNVRSGFLLVDRDMKIEEGFTKSCYELFGDNIKSGMRFSRLFDFSAREEDHFETCYRQVFDDIIPEHISIDQSPQRVPVGDSMIGLAASAVRDKEGKIQCILFTVNDITALVKAEKWNKHNESMLNILGHKFAFAKFLDDSKELIREANGIVDFPKSIGRLKVILHTLKGNAAAFGLSEIVHFIHNVEEKEEIFASDIEDVELQFKKYLDNTFEILGIRYDASAEKTYKISETKVDELAIALENVNSLEKFKQVFSLWQYEIDLKEASIIIGPIEDMVERLARRQFKKVDFIYTGKSTNVDSKKFGKIAQVLPHLVRNCIDHGLEEPTLRGKKEAMGNLELNIIDHPEYWSLEVSDDGAGINIEKVTEKAIAKQIITRKDAENMSEEEKLLLILEAGVSTVEEANDVSGRGLGMTALHQVVEEVEGTLKITSKPNIGTKFEITIPKAEEFAKKIRDAA